MTPSERVLVDTTAFYALYSPTDQFHNQATAACEQLIGQDRELWTTSYALVETIALLHRRLGFSVASQFEVWRQANVEVFWVDDMAHDAAWAQLMAHEGSGLSLVGWTTVMASRQLGAPVFAFDRGFASQGLSVLPG